MTYYLKKSLFILFVLLLPCMNHTSKAMQEENDSINLPRRHLTIKNDFDEINIPPQPSSTATSWTSYLVFNPLEKALQSTAEIMNYVSKNPKKALALGLLYQTAAVVAVSNYWFCWIGEHGPRAEVWWAPLEDSNTQELGGIYIPSNMPSKLSNPEAWTCRHHFPNGTNGQNYRVWVNWLQ